MTGATQRIFLLTKEKFISMNFFHSIPKMYYNLKRKTTLEVSIKCTYHPLVRKSKNAVILVDNLYL